MKLSKREKEMLKRIINNIDPLLGMSMIFGLLSILLFSCEFPVKLASPKSNSTIVDSSNGDAGDSPVSKENEVRNDNSVIKTEKKVIAKNIYTGTTAVIIGCCSMAIIFLIAIGLFIKWSKTNTMLNLVTKAIKESHPKTQTDIKNKINELDFINYNGVCVVKNNLSKYVRKNKTHV